MITYLSRQLGLPVVSEGVETANQAEMLRELGCSFAQGYYFAKPMPRAEYEAQVTARGGQNGRGNGY